jgi:cytochrome P450
METLRLEQSEYIHRRVRETFEHDGFVFPAGWLLRLCVRESHRSEEIWSDAATFDPDRFLRQPMPKSQYSPFGFLEHACSGVDLSAMICRVTLEELAAFDWAIASDGELERYFGHWSHWEPSSRLRIRLSTRSAEISRPA